MLQERPRTLITPTPAPGTAVPSRTGAITVWAILGAAWIVFVAQALGRWVASDQFEPAPINGPDTFGGGWLVVLRIIEVASLGIAAATIWVYLLRPLIRERRFELDGMIVIGALLASAIDPLINYFEYTFAWNAHAWNAGTWINAFPLSTGPDDYAEGLAWFVPQYLYLGIGFAAIECRIIQRLRVRWPSASNVRTFATATSMIFVLDILVEQLFVRTHVYAYPRTIEALTLWPGSEFQFPIYESVFVALYALGFTALRMSAIDSPDGLSFVERGVQRIRPGARKLTRLLAVTGFCAAWAALSYFIPWSWMSVNADSINHKVPTYMLPSSEMATYSSHPAP